MCTDYVYEQCWMDVINKISAYYIGLDQSLRSLFFGNFEKFDIFDFETKWQSK